MERIVKISDGLGNQVFQYAFARSLQKRFMGRVLLDISDINNNNIKEASDILESRKNGLRVYSLDKFRIMLPVADIQNVSNWNYYFEEGVINEVKRQMNSLNLWPWQYIEEEQYVEKFNPLYSVYYRGYWFDLKYYKDLKSILKKELHLKKRVKLPRELNYMLKNKKVNAVHIRRGDFLRLGRDISDKNYYSKAFDVMSDVAKGDNVYFVFSDDISWVKNNMRIPGTAIFISELGFHDYEEFAIMRACHNYIIANSTFSYWPAFLNDGGIVICPKKWKSKIIPEEWIRI